MRMSDFSLRSQGRTNAGDQVAPTRFQPNDSVVAHTLCQCEQEQGGTFLAEIDKGMQGETHPFDPSAFKAEMRTKYGHLYPGA